MLRHALRATRPTTRPLAILALVVAPFFLLSEIDGAAAQAPGIMAPGDAVVTGFPGVLPPPPPVVGNPLDETFINPDGASLRILKLQPAGPPTGQLIASPTVFQAPARTVGQVFPITFDDWPNPNVFVGASSAFGIQIVAPDSDGDGRPERITTGQPGATFMAGQWGAGGSPGSIYRIDGTTGAITLFTTIGANSGAGLGDVVFDRSSRQFFVSDLDTGHIYRLDAAGVITDTFDHGVDGRPVHGLPPVADDGVAMNIASPAFDTTNPDTWGYAPPERRVRGMAVQGGRLYYAVARDLQVWSIGIRLDGTFANDPRWEFDVAGLASTDEIADIAFDHQGRMILAQRGPQRGSYDYTVFAEPKTSAVVRYTREVPDNPATPGTWVPVADEYAIGLRPQGRNATGGVALGYGHDATTGAMRNGACGEYLWSTGDSLRDNAAMAGFLAAGGPADVHGLQGNHHALVRPANDPPLQSFFADYDGLFSDPQNQGHVGDVEIWEPCQGGTYYPPYIPPYFPPPGYTPPPADTFNLTLDKEAIPETCAPDGGGWQCSFTVRVTNTGTTPYFGPITVDDGLLLAPAATTMSFAPTPPWVCGMIGPLLYECTYPPVFLWPGQSVDLYVTVNLPATSLCRLDNVAQIVWPWGGLGDANPADDFDVATAIVPSPDCPPPEGDRTNLKIEKYTLTDPCTDLGAAWRCDFLVRVLNDGPGVYNGDIEISDTLSVPDPIVYALAPPWTCVPPAGGAYTCTYPGATLNPGESVWLWLRVVTPKAVLADAGACVVTNEARITKAPGGSPQNTNPGDDTASAEAKTPGDNCEPLDRRSDLAIRKVGEYCVPFTANDQPSFACFFSIWIANFGPDDYSGPLSFKDTFIGFTPVPPSPAFAPPFCVPDGGGGYDCGPAGDINFPAGPAPGPILVGVIVPDNGEVCEITNRVEITVPAGGSPGNTNPANDVSQAVLMIPSERCQPTAQPQQQQICPLLQRMPDGGCCPEGQTWSGQQCAPPGASAPPTPPPPVTRPTCPPGTTGIPPNCTPVQQVCPAGSVGTWPNCRCPSGTTGTPPNCTPIVQRCPTGTTGTYPNCVPVQQQVCPAGSVGTWPNCRCPQGTTGTPPNCTPIVQRCPTGTTGTYPNCVPIQQQTCPPGSVGTWPNCRCPQGTTGTPPNCTPIVQRCPPGTAGIFPLCIPVQQTCPPGSVGTPPNCRCPSGTTGTPPNCVKLPTTTPTPPPSGGTITTPPLFRAPTLQLPTCPAGTTGIYPNCVPLSQQLK